MTAPLSVTGREKGARAHRLGATVDTALGELRHAWRSIRRSPGFSLVVIVTLTLGIGANAAMYSVVRSVLWRPLPYPRSDRIVNITVDARGAQDVGATHGELLDLRAGSRAIELISTLVGVDSHVSIGGETERVPAASVSDDVLPLLGVVPVLGRSLRAAEDEGASMRVAISHRLWQRRFGGESTVLGRRVQINNRQMEIVAVLPAGFRVFAPRSTNAGEEIDVWFPMAIGEARDARGFEVFGRLKEGVTLEAAQAELDLLGARLVQDHAQAYPDGALKLTVNRLRHALTREARAGLAALFGAVGFVLVIACANVANLMLARSKARETEFAVRRALGAGGWRVARVVVIESLLLSSIGGVIGLLLAYWSLDLVEWLQPVNLPRRSGISLDGVAVAFTAALSIISGLAFGLFPALWSSTAPGQALAATRSQTGGAALRRLQPALVSTEIAFSIVPLVAAGLLLRTFVNLSYAPIGFDPQGLQTARISVNFSQFREIPKRWAFQRDVLERVGQLPGVDVVTAASPLPFAPTPADAPLWPRRPECGSVVSRDAADDFAWISAADTDRDSRGA